MGDFNAWDPGNMGYGNSGWELAIELKKDSTGIFSTTQEFDYGDTIKYLYTRGSHYSTEYSFDGKQRNKRNIVVKKNETIIDTIETWRDYYLTETKNVILVPLQKQSPEKMIMDGKPRTNFGSLLYDEEMRNTFAKGYRISNHINKIPSDLTDTISFPFVISDAPDNSIIILAGKRENSNEWSIFVDKNNDNEIDESEFIFEALEKTDTTLKREDTLEVAYDKLVDDKIKIDTVTFIVGSYSKPLLDQYRSSLREDAPVLTYGLYFDLREGIFLEGDKEFKISVSNIPPGSSYGFKSFFILAIDLNNDDKYDFSKGSLENIQVYKESMGKPINLGDVDINILDIDNDGNWIKVFASEKIKTEIRNTTPGNPAPEWEGVSLTGEKVSNTSKGGKFILLDFWATWCKPCIEELKNIKTAHQDFSVDKLEIIGILVDEDKEKVQSFIVNNQITWLQIFDDASTIKNKFSINGIPDPILISPDGKIVERGQTLRGSNLYETLKKYLE
jgi:thiol-disulfide isomerase/thioredoxin